MLICCVGLVHHNFLPREKEACIDGILYIPQLSCPNTPGRFFFLNTALYLLSTRSPKWTRWPAMCEVTSFPPIPNSYTHAKQLVSRLAIR